MAAFCLPDAPEHQRGAPPLKVPMVVSCRRGFLLEEPLRMALLLPWTSFFPQHIHLWEKRPRQAADFSYLHRMDWSY